MDPCRQEPPARSWSLLAWYSEVAMGTAIWLLPEETGNLMAHVPDGS
ncbi:hypothetical protein [Fervidicola ferrireducens]|nr:hypothetical protein [Fervidicola ferrireducens]